MNNATVHGLSARTPDCLKSQPDLIYKKSTLSTIWMNRAGTKFNSGNGVGVGVGVGASTMAMLAPSMWYSGRIIVEGVLADDKALSNILDVRTLPWICHIQELRLLIWFAPQIRGILYQTYFSVSFGLGWIESFEAGSTL